MSGLSIKYVVFQFNSLDLIVDKIKEYFGLNTLEYFQVLHVDERYLARKCLKDEMSFKKRCKMKE